MALAAAAHSLRRARVRAVWWSAYRIPGDGDGERCHLNASAAYCLASAYGCRYCDPFLEAADIRRARGDGDEMDALTDILATLNRYADSDGDPRHRRAGHREAQAVTYTLASTLTPWEEASLEWYAVLEAHGAVPNAVEIVYAYDRWCMRYGIDADLALAQACHESAYFTSKRWREEWNPAGLRITSTDTPPNPFPSLDAGIRAHCEHLCCHIYTVSACPVDHAHASDRYHVFHRGEPALQDIQKAPYRWAAGTPGGDPLDYVRSIVSIANSVGGTPMATAPTAAALGYPGTVQYATGSGETMAIEDVRWFIVHDTEGGFAGSKATLSGQISAHLLIDKDGTWCFMVPLTGVAYAAGNLPVNRQSINVEHVGYADAHDGGYTDAQYRCCAAFYRWCVKQGMVNVPAVYIGKVDANGGPEPDVPGILGHMDVPHDDGTPGWGGNYGHTDPGPHWDWSRFMHILTGPVTPPGPDPPPLGWQYVDGVLLGPGFLQLLFATAEGTDARLRTYGRLIRGDHDATLTKADGTTLPVIAATFERRTLIWDKGATAPPWDVRTPLQTEKVSAT